MNIKCFYCGYIYTGDKCPRCGAPVNPPNQAKPTKKGMPAGAIIAIVFGSIFALLIFAYFLFGILANTKRIIENKASSTSIETPVDTAEVIPYFELSQGEYAVGKDIPAGTYDITGISGWGFLWIYRNEDLFEKDISTEVINLYDGKDDNEILSKMYTTAYNNLRLKEGQYIKIEKTIVIGFYTH